MLKLLLQQREGQSKYFQYIDIPEWSVCLPYVYSKCMHYTVTATGLYAMIHRVYRVSFETSFNSKQLKLKQKIVSALFKTNVCFGRLFRFNIETTNFGSIETNRNNRTERALCL
jgi:hypothetical protein